MCTPRLTRRLSASAVLGVGLILGVAAPAVAQQQTAAVVTRGEHESAVDASTGHSDSLVLAAVVLGLAAGAGVALFPHRRCFH